MILRRHFMAMLAAAMPAVSIAECDRRDQEYWNGKFNDPKTRFRREPSRLLVEAIAGRKPGRAIDLGMGEGRNAIYLAQQGWR